ncbi:MAG: YbaK/EbsC family protein [Alphaproteobacteria bacterium]|nr:YbaK/EbsC family protein [Alphaproteobacteria bacterium]
MAGDAKLRGSAQRVQAALDKAGIAAEVMEFPETTRTAEEAAAAIGCTVAQIAKSLVFRSAENGRPVLVIASGSNRVDEKKVTALLGEAIEKPDAEFVRDRTGFAIGGVPPAGHREPLITFIDRDLLDLERIWAAAGTPFAVFALSPNQLVELTGGQVADLKRG